MSPAKWTPGPYSADGRMIIAGTRDHLPYVLANVTQPLPGVNLEGLAEDTAHLFAASPEMYAALSEMVRVVGGTLEGYGILTAPMEAARAALAKARGETV